MRSWIKKRRSLPVRGAWIEMEFEVYAKLLRKSLPVRGAWIEMTFLRVSIALVIVAPRAGSVD